MKRLSFNQAYFIKSAKKPSEYPSGNFPEMAVVGRSNVGKSSLLNSLFQSKSLVKTSSTPGKTQMLNFFSVDSSINLVDLPGYGFAKANSAGWDEMISSYLQGREQLKLTLFLLDSRRTPSAQDMQMAEMLSTLKIPTLLVITKTDKVPKTKLQSQVQHILKTLQLENHPYVLYSTLKNEGRPSLIQWIHSCLY